MGKLKHQTIKVTCIEPCQKLMTGLFPYYNIFNECYSNNVGYSFQHDKQFE